MGEREVEVEVKEENLQEGEGESRQGKHRRLLAWAPVSVRSAGRRGTGRGNVR